MPKVTRLPRGWLGDTQQYTAASPEAQLHPPSPDRCALTGSIVKSNAIAGATTWSQQDDETLINARAQGLNWNQISPKYFPSKTSNNCRKRHEWLIERQNTEQWDGVRVEVLAEAYMEVRSEMWRILGAKVNEKWQLVEQKCMEKGLKNLTQAYREAQRKEGNRLVFGDDSGIGISDVEDDPNEGLSPVLTDASNQLPLVYQQPTTTRVPSIHSMLQHPQHPQHPQSIMQQHNLEYPTSAYEPPWLQKSYVGSTETCSAASSKNEQQEEQANKIEQDQHRAPTPPTDHPSQHLVSSPNADHVSTPSVISDQSIESDVDETEAQKELLLNRLMVRFYDLFDDPDSPYRRCQSSSASPKGASSNVTALKVVDSVGNSKHHHSFERDKDDEELEDRPNKRPRKTDHRGASSEEETKKSFACPFFKHDPEKYCTARSCSGPVGWENIARLKEHLYRRHTRPTQCVRCCATFPGEDKLEEHQRAPEGCSIRSQESLEGLTKPQIEQLKRRSRMFQAGSEEEKWKIIYLICFPDTALGAMPTPFYEHEAAETNIRDQSPKDPTLAQYEAYMNRELPRKVRKELEIAMGKLFGPLEETLKNQLEGLVRNCQEILSRDYESSKASVEDQSTDTTSGIAASSGTGTQPQSLSQTSSTTTSSVLAPYTVPMDSVFDPWQGVDATSGLQTCMYSDSAYFSEINYPLPSDPWWPSMIDTAPTLPDLDPSHMGMTSSVEPDSLNRDNAPISSHIGKGKGRADHGNDG